MYLAASSNPTITPPRQAALSTLSYRSRLVDRQALDFSSLEQGARERNRAEQVTSMMICDGARVFQCLEGPPAALDRIWASIQRDPRHSEIELVGQHTTSLRLFGDFELKLNAPRTDAAPSRRTSGAERLACASLSSAAETCAVLDAETNDFGRFKPAVGAELLEKAARLLGDMWQADQCEEAEITLGLGYLQTWLRRSADSQCARDVLEGAPTVLIVPFPSETHLLRASLDADVMWRAGWQPQVDFPLDAEALCRLLREQHFDVLDLSLSAAFVRAHWLPRLKAVVAKARGSSANRQLTVVVGGRIFSEQPDLAAKIGADAAIESSVTAQASIVASLAENALRTGRRAARA